MNKKFLRLLSLILVISLVVSFSACSDDKKSDKDSGSKDEEITLKLWHIWAADTEVGKEPLLNTIDKFQEENSNIKVEVEAYENESYKTKIKTSMQGEIPDVFFSWGAGFADQFIKAGKILPLDDYVSDVEGNFMEGTTDSFIGEDGKLYGIPVYRWAAILYCNEELFEQNNVELPETFDQLLTAIEVFNSKDITPIAVGEKDKWPGMFFQNIAAIRTAGVQLSNDALNGKESFDQDQFVESAEIVEELVAANAFGDNPMALSNDEAQQEFMQGKAAMRYMGSWEAGNVEDDQNKVKGKVVCKNFPTIDGTSGDQEGFLGGAVDTFMVSQETEYPEEATKLLKYIAENLSEQSAIAGFGLPAWNSEIDESQISDTSKQIIDVTSNSTGYVLAWDTFLQGAAADTHKDLVAQLFSGDLKSKDFGIQMQEAAESE
jgi:raffinose/stachyose/melibiose transport system substrate-binding protein